MSEIILKSNIYRGDISTDIKMEKAHKYLDQNLTFSLNL